MLCRIVAFRALAAGILIVNLNGQEPKSQITRLRELGLPELSGSVPTLYAPAAKARAIRLQRSLSAAHVWYEKQLNIHVPIILAVLDAETREKISDPVQMPHSNPFLGLIVLPDRTPPGQGPPSQGGPAGIDRDHAPGGIMQGEHTLFHEDGHILAQSSLKIRSGNSFVNELIAGMFMVAYIGAQRPDLNFLLEDRRSGRMKRDGPRYTSLADLDYLYSGVGDQNYFWFQWHLERLADFLVKDQDFPSVIAKLQKAFPANEARQMTYEEINSRLENVRPGFIEVAGALAGPTSIPLAMPSACQGPQKGEGSSYVVVHNKTAAPIEVTFPDGGNARTPAHMSRSYRIGVGSSLKLPDGTCLVGRDEPTLSVIEKQ